MSSVPYPPPVNGKHAVPKGPEWVLARLDNRTLFSVAQLSTRDWLARHGITGSQLSSGHVVIKSELPGEAFFALRSALFLRVRPLTDLTCIMTSVDAKVMYQLDALISWFSPPMSRLATLKLDFGGDMIPHATTGKSTARALTKLVSGLTSDCRTTVFVLQDGLFTCRPDALRRWSPATGHYEGGWTWTTYASVRMHDGARQRRQIPLDSAAPAPFNKWKLVVVDIATLTDLQLSIKLAAHEWAAVLGALELPALVCVGLWAETISTAVGTQFFNRHPKLRTIKYMSPAADALPVSCAPLRLPHLESLNTLVPYLIHILDSDADPSSSSAARFPSLVHIELRPHIRLREALLHASTHTPLSTLTLWSLSPLAFPFADAPPVFPTVRRLLLNEIRGVKHALAAGLPKFIAVAFPALTKLELNYCWGANVDISRVQVRREQRALVEQVGAANPGVHTFLFDGKEQPIGEVS
ncbi:hypothetical protein C8R43DRAFT_977138 [Mycena crocata]|nr:hypothetical protein C8R43DRAFT_977138 [Mycena crocata]